MERIGLERSGDPTDAEERRLVARARRGDSRAFDRLVRGHYSRVYGCAFRLVGNHEDAEDLAQECFVKAHRAMGWYRGEGSLATWLRRILVHLARDRFRARGRRPASTPIPPGLEPLAKRAPHSDADHRELGRLLSEAIGRLPDHLRVPLVLRTLEGLDYDEISRTTGVTAATARTQVMKARKALHRLLAPYLEEGTP